MARSLRRGAWGRGAAAQDAQQLPEAVDGGLGRDGELPVQECAGLGAVGGHAGGGVRAAGRPSGDDVGDNLVGSRGIHCGAALRRLADACRPNVRECTLFPPPRRSPARTDLLIGGVFRKIGAGCEKPLAEVGHIDVTERFGEEVVDQHATFAGVHVGGAGHQSQSFLGSATCDSAQDGLVGPQSANLRLQGLDVCGRHLCETLLTIQGGPDFTEPHAQVAQGAGRLHRATPSAS